MPVRLEFEKSQTTCIQNILSSEKHLYMKKVNTSVKILSRVKQLGPGDG